MNKCRGCGKDLLPENENLCADGCPCNSPRGINHGLVPKHVCTCTECDPEQTGSIRKPPLPRWGFLLMNRAFMFLHQLTLIVLFVPLPDLGKMSDRDAELLAEKKWSGMADWNGWVGHAEKCRPDMGEGECAVGIRLGNRNDGYTFYIFGRGKTWENAFAEAEYIRGH